MSMHIVICFLEIGSQSMHASTLYVVISNPTLQFSPWKNLMIAFVQLLEFCTLQDGGVKSKLPKRTPRLSPLRSTPTTSDLSGAQAPPKPRREMATTAGATPTAMDEKARRTRDLLASFYNTDPAAAGAVPASPARPSPAAASASPLESINSASFNPDVYMDVLVRPPAPRSLFTWSIRSSSRCLRRILCLGVHWVDYERIG
jgi:hypothetical protein